MVIDPGLLDRFLERICILQYVRETSEKVFHTELLYKGYLGDFLLLVPLSGINQASSPITIESRLGLSKIGLCKMGSRLPVSKLRFIRDMIESQSLTMSQMAKEAECSKRTSSIFAETYSNLEASMYL